MTAAQSPDRIDPVDTAGQGTASAPGSVPPPGPRPCDPRALLARLGVSRGLGLAMAIALAVLLPFLRKAYTIDDVTFLLQAQHLLKDPGHPTAFVMIFHGQPMRLSGALVSGPVMSMLLLPAVLAGGAEWVAHLLQIALLLLGLVGTAALGLRLGLSRGEAGLAALLVACSPAVLAMAATGMPDVPAMTFGVFALERLLAWRASGRRSDALLAVLLLLLAILSRPHQLLLLPVGALLLLPRAGLRAGFARSLLRLFHRGLWPLVLAAALLLLVNYATRDPSGGNHLAAATLSRMHLYRFWNNLANIPAQWALCFPLAALWLTSRYRVAIRQPTFWIALLAGIYLGLQQPNWELRPAVRQVIVAIVALSSGVLGAILGDAVRRRDPVQLALWLLLVAAAPTALYVHLPPKYLVPAAPAMAILLVQALRGLDLRRLWLRLVPCVGIGAVLAVLIIRADAAMAEVGRAGGLQVADAMRQGVPVWMDGAWGFQWYAMQAGARPMTTGGVLPSRGDLVVVGPQGGRIAQCPQRTLLRSQRFMSTVGWVIGHGAGFYSNVSTPLPWSWGPGELGRIEVYRID